MPYIPDLSDEAVSAVGKYLFSIALRPRQPEPDVALADDLMRFDRRALWNHYGEQSPVGRREDFFEALRQLADGELYEAVQLVNGSARAVHVLLARDALLWEPLFYDDVDEIDQDIARELLTAQGYDITTAVPDAHHIYRPRVKHDPEAPRTCTKCRETKRASEFDRRGVPGTPGYDRFQSHCQDCKREAATAFRKARPGYDTRERPGRSRRARRGLVFGIDAA